MILYLEQSLVKVLQRSLFFRFFFTIFFRFSNKTRSNKETKKLTTSAMSVITGFKNKAITRKIIICIRFESILEEQ